MKSILTFALLFLAFSCSEKQELSHTETATIVAQSFFSKDESALKKYTTSEGYASLVTVLNMIPEFNKEIKVDILDEAIEGDIAWVKYKTSFDGKMGVFKLVKENGQWKVTSKGVREKGPF